MKKKSKIIYILILLIVLAVIIDLFLVFKNKNNEDPKNNTEQVREISCNTQINEITNEELGISYESVSDYYLLINDKNELVPNGYTNTVTFKNLDDLNKYYNYMLSEFKLSSQFKMEKDEENLRVYHFTPSLYGENKNTNLDELKKLEEEGWTCQEMKNDSN